MLPPAILRYTSGYRHALQQYVDNIVSGCQSLQSSQQAVHYYKIARYIMKQANFNLRAWASNCQLVQSFTEADHAADSGTIVNVLGTLKVTLYIFRSKQLSLNTTLSSPNKMFCSSHQKYLTHWGICPL